MRNLINAVTTEEKKRLEDFIFNINQVNDLKSLDTWQYNDLVPKGKVTFTMSLNEKKAYLISRKEKSVYKAIEREVKKITTVQNAGDLLNVKISVEWKKNRTWGSNPTAEAWVSFTDKNGHNSDYFKSGSIGGCGYDKGSTAVANVLNQSNEVLKLLYTLKDQHINMKNHELFGYGSGYGILPSIEGGVGVNCYPAIFEKLGYKFSTVASGKNFDVFTIDKN